jgi:hypothetical protein
MNGAQGSGDFCQVLHPDPIFHKDGYRVHNPISKR